MNDLPLTAPLRRIPHGAWGDAAPSTVSPSAARVNQPEYTVSELSLALKRAIEDGFGFVRVRGEVSGWKRHASGHCYFALKDSDAVLDAVCWRGTASRLDIRPEDGMEIICSGKLTTYAGRSKYQLVVERIELAGIGALLKMLEERRRRLMAEGLFAAERKKKLPFLPEVIGIVTSPTGAVIRDILHRLADRFPRRVLLWPVAVQGEGAAAQIAAAIEGFNRIEAAGGAVPRPDLLIVARGGGSIEDLMAFNEEIVVRAAAASLIPLISAVGHETDTTLIDHASDRRAPTPTAAAEMAVPVRLDLIGELGGRAARLAGGLSRLLTESRLHLRGWRAACPTRRICSARRRSVSTIAAKGCVWRSGRARGGTAEPRYRRVRAAAGGAGRRYRPGARALRRARNRLGPAMARAVDGEARRARQFLRKARDPFRAPRQPVGARLCRRARRVGRGRHRGGDGAAERRP